MLIYAKNTIFEEEEPKQSISLYLLLDIEFIFVDPLIIEKYFFKNEIVHRIDGPAIDCEKVKVYIVDGLMHCVSGPAIKWNNHMATSWYDEGERYFINGKEYKKSLIYKILNYKRKSSLTLTY